HHIRHHTSYVSIGARPRSVPYRLHVRREHGRSGTRRPQLGRDHHLPRGYPGHRGLVHPQGQRRHRRLLQGQWSDPGVGGRILHLRDNAVGHHLHVHARAGLPQRLVLRRGQYRHLRDRPAARDLLHPFFRKLDVTTAYEYLEERFGPSIRVLGSVLFVLFHIGRVAIVIYLPTLAISSVTDINPALVAGAVGVLSVVYTFLGGIEGVIWSDVVQGIILLVGAGVILVFGIAALDGGLATVVSDAAADDKFISADNWKFGGAAA